jgi:hypothetical protein
METSHARRENAGRGILTIERRRVANLIKANSTASQMSTASARGKTLSAADERR